MVAPATPPFPPRPTLYLCPYSALCCRRSKSKNHPPNTEALARLGTPAFSPLQSRGSGKDWLATIFILQDGAKFRASFGQVGQLFLVRSPPTLAMCACPLHAPPSSPAPPSFPAPPPSPSPSRRSHPQIVLCALPAFFECFFHHRPPFVVFATIDFFPPTKERKFAPTDFPPSPPPFSSRRPPLPPLSPAPALEKRSCAAYHFRRS